MGITYKKIINSHKKTHWLINVLCYVKKCFPLQKINNLCHINLRYTFFWWWSLFRFLSCYHEIFSFVISFMIKSEGGSLKSFQEFYSSSKEGSWNREVLHIRRVAVRCWFDFIKDQITRTTSSISWLVSTQRNVF